MARGYWREFRINLTPHPSPCEREGEEGGEGEEGVETEYAFTKIIGETSAAFSDCFLPLYTTRHDNLTPNAKITHSLDCIERFVLTNTLVGFPSDNGMAPQP